MGEKASLADPLRLPTGPKQHGGHGESRGAGDACTARSRSNS